MSLNSPRFACDVRMTGSGIHTARPIESYRPSPSYSYTPRSNYPTNSYWDSRESLTVRPPNLDAFRYVKTAGSIEYRARKRRTTELASSAPLPTLGGNSPNISHHHSIKIKYPQPPYPRPHSHPQDSSTSTSTSSTSITDDYNSHHHHHHHPHHSQSHTRINTNNLSNENSWLWRTSNSEFGRDAPQLRIPESVRYFPKTHNFTSSFNGLMHKYYGLSTAKDEVRTARVDYFGDP